MNTKQKIKIQCIKAGNISLNELARRCGWASSNFSVKLNNDNWMISDLKLIAQALGCDLYTAYEYNGEQYSSDNMSELIRIQCVLAGDIPLSTLADRLGISKSALNNRLTRNTWRTKDLEQIAAALDSTFICEFTPIS